MPVIAGLSKEGTRLIKTDFSGARWEAFPYLQRIGLSVCFFFCPPFILLSSGPTMDLNRGGRWSPYHTTPYPSAHKVLSNTVLPSLAKLYSTQPNERPQAQHKQTQQSTSVPEKGRRIGHGVLFLLIKHAKQKKLVPPCCIMGSTAYRRSFSNIHAGVRRRGNWLF